MRAEAETILRFLSQKRMLVFLCYALLYALTCSPLKAEEIEAFFLFCFWPQLFLWYIYHDMLWFSKFIQKIDAIVRKKKTTEFGIECKDQSKTMT